MKILIASSISPHAIEKLRQKHDVICAFNADEATLKKRIRDRDAVILRSGVSLSAAVMRCAPHLKLLVRAGSGTDNIDLNYIREHGVKLERIPEPGAKAVAEMAFTLMLALARNLFEADRTLRQGQWRKSALAGSLLTGKTLGIVGAGNIGARVGWMGAAWGMRALGCVENPTRAIARQLAGKNIRLAAFDEVIAESDFLCIHVPLTAGTKNLIDATVLARMKPCAILVNLARGGVVDEQALYNALAVEGRLAGAALDVHQREGEGHISPLADLPNVILTPHIGAQTIDSQREIGDRVLKIVAAYAYIWHTTQQSDYRFELQKNDFDFEQQCAVPA